MPTVTKRRPMNEKVRFMVQVSEIRFLSGKCHKWNVARSLTLRDMLDINPMFLFVSKIADAVLLHEITKYYQNSGKTSSWLPEKGTPDDVRGDAGPTMEGAAEIAQDRDAWRCIIETMRWVHDPT